MALSYGDVAGFARRHGKVVIKPGGGAKLTVLKSGELDSHVLIEAKSTRFFHKGEEYTSSEFEKLVQAEANNEMTRQRTSFGKDQRRKHRHWQATVFYLDGEKFARIYTNREKAHRFARPWRQFDQF